MALWAQVIVEWVNCLAILEKPVKDINELESSQFYKKLMSLLPWKNNKDILNNEDVIRHFIQVEYPAFKFVDGESFKAIELIYITSLILLRTSEDPVLQQAMCTKLPQDIQFKIKTFLEQILPDGKDITKERMKQVIDKIEDVTPNITMTPQSRALKEFFNSPAARSAHCNRILTERNREIRHLQLELETQFAENACLQEELKIQQNKTQDLQRKVEEKCAALKVLREQQMKPNTPQPNKTNQDIHQSEDFYKKEINQLEDLLKSRHCEVDKLEEEKDVLSKKLLFLERQYTLLEQKSRNSEKTLEYLQLQSDAKDKELISLRMTNEELRTYLRELNSTSGADQSFEIDGIETLNSTLVSLNTGEVLSSVIDIQLQEAKKESITLKAQLCSLNKQLESMTMQKEKMKELNVQLEEKNKILEVLKDKLEDVSNRLQLSNKNYQNLQERNSCLIDEMKFLKESLETKEKLLLHAQDVEKALNLRIDALNKAVKELQKSLCVETTKRCELDFAFAQAESEIKMNNKHMQDMQEEHTKYSMESARQITNMKEKLKKQQETLMNENERKVETLKLEMKAVTRDLEDSKEQCILKQQEINNMLEEIKLKDTEIETLLAKINGLESETMHLKYLHKQEESETKNIIERLEVQLLDKQHAWDQLNMQACLKKEMLDLLNSKMEKMTKENKELITSELKMKEVIVNLQELRASQDAVLATQEKALKEKCKHLKHLEEEYEQVKSKLGKQLEDEKSQWNNLQIKYAELEAKVCSQTENIDKLNECLRNEKCKNDRYKEHENIENKRNEKILNICEILKQTMDELRSSMTWIVQSPVQFYDDDIQNAENDNENTYDILFTLNTAIKELRASQKVILHLQNRNKTLHETIQELELIAEIHAKCEKAYQTLKNEMDKLEAAQQKRNKHIQNLVKCKETLNESLQPTVILRKKVDATLIELMQKWEKATITLQNVLVKDKSIFDKPKNLQIKKLDVESILSSCIVSHLQNLKPLLNVLLHKFLWSEKLLEYNVSSESASSSTYNLLGDNQDVIQTEFQKNEKLLEDIKEIEKKVDNLIVLIVDYESALQRDDIEQCNVEKKLQVQINSLTKEKVDLKKKLENVRVRNVKLERNMDDLRAEIRKLKMETLSTVQSEKLESLMQELAKLKEENIVLQQEKQELMKQPEKEELADQLKEVQARYEEKLEDIKQKMKMAYNEHVAKLSEEQSKSMQKKLEVMQKKMLEQHCCEHTNEISKYKKHINELNTQSWSIGEKLLMEQQEKQKLIMELSRLKIRSQNAHSELSDTSLHSTFGKRDSSPGNSKEKLLQRFDVIQEETRYERRCSVRSIQAMSNAFSAVDEEGELFDNTYLADMKKGNSLPSTDPGRLLDLKRRNSLCLPHLKSSYPAETQFHPLSITEEEIKSGSVMEEIFNDSLNQSLLPEHKPKKKDRTQTSYKKPGPPTPSKNGGRLSLQGNEFRSPSSRILRERNVDRRTTITPRALKNLFTSKRQDENNLVTPKGRRISSIFRKSRLTSDR